MTPWSVAHQLPLSMEFSRQEYWSGLPFSSLGDLPNPGIEPQSPALQVDSLLSEPSGKLKLFSILTPNTICWFPYYLHDLSIWCHMHECVLSHFSYVQLFVTLWTRAPQVPLSMGFSRQEYWSGLPCPPPRDLHNPGIKPMSLISSALAGRFFITSTTWEAPGRLYLYSIKFYKLKS